MNRFLTLASTGLFATGLAILPVSAFAQANVSGTAAAGVDSKSTTTTGVVGSTVMPLKADAGKVVTAPASPATDAKTGAKAGVTAGAAAGSTTMGTTAATGAKVTTAPAPAIPPVATTPKTGG